jgi:hypothetical protein
MFRMPRLPASEEITESSQPLTPKIDKRLDPPFYLINFLLEERNKTTNYYSAHRFRDPKTAHTKSKAG